MIEDLEAARAQAIAKDKCFSKTTLRKEFRMKPKPNAEPVRTYKNDFGRSFGVYRVADCVPLRDVRRAKPSKKQLEARAILGLEAKKRSNEARASAVANTWLESDPLFIDTETTGLGKNDQVLEVAITNVAGDVLFEARIRPTVPISYDAGLIHGITADDLASASGWPDICEKVRQLLQGRTVVAFNASFDKTMMVQTANAFSSKTDWIKALDFRCAMNLAVAAYGATNFHGTIALSDALDFAGVTQTFTAHSAKGDAAATGALICTLARVYREIEDQISLIKN